MIMPFDLFGLGKYVYTFEEVCREYPELSLNDGAKRIFINTHGKNTEDVSPENSLNIIKVKIKSILHRI